MVKRKSPKEIIELSDKSREHTLIKFPREEPIYVTKNQIEQVQKMILRK